MKFTKKTMLMIFAITVLLMGVLSYRASSSADISKRDLQERVQVIFQSRASASVTGSDPEKALSYYDTTTMLGRWALEHEKSKLKYIQLWSQKRGVNIIEANSTIKIPWSQVVGDNAELTVDQTLQLGYVYQDDPTVNRFGIGTRHWMKLTLKNGKWFILQDFYTDGLGDNSLALDPIPSDGPAVVKKNEHTNSAASSAPSLLNREGTVKYADEFAGLAWGAGNDNQYNIRYRDYNDQGGDCTNFVSQCLGDQEGGRLPMDDNWFYNLNEGAGSQAWVRAETFGDWLVYSGWGQRLARGTFQELNTPGEKYPRGAVRELQKGDVIGYGKIGYSAHMAIVVGYDSKGYPLVNSHNVDRYHCPWDMGYDKSTIYHLYKFGG
ncbi:amidase domain-containing protein [Pelotomaculum isophthalicicum JI]|uniref:Amidase domain-containing protein n=1 Tax=Pelotomaculum isophthalicicum JI TaxID=947010 RepID=A0A9X4JVT8_9FIRM|nr:amidase domain-containing protein [Pelotomaculum isophthalicicum]MDF9407992.1 amidase domain-containing protein [Pelotomaculum isophthalicicum JI]